MINKIQIFVIIILLGFGALYLYSENQNVPIKNFFLPGTPMVHIGEMPLRVEIVNSDEERTRGLSGREKLEGIDGMLFVFPEADYHRIWMKDMRFPIDIIWISEDLTVINIERNVTPESYPHVFKPDQPARFAVETNIHYSDTFGLAPGKKVRLPENYLEN